MQWAFSSTSFYPNNKHELNNINCDKYNIIDFNLLPEEPDFEVKYYTKKDGEEVVWNQYYLYRICGTVTSKDKNKRTVDILTPSNDVVTIRLADEVYTYYEQKISEGTDTNKTVIDDSWFTRGKMLCVVGYRQGDGFRGKRYRNSIFKHTIMLIEKVNQDGSLELRTERKIKD